MFTVNKTYDVITPESAEIGDFDESGFEFEDRRMSLHDILREIENSGFRLTNSISSIQYLKDSKSENRFWLETVDPERNYSTGSETFYGFHIDCQARHFYKICKLAKLL